MLDNARRYGEAPFCLHTEIDGDIDPVHGVVGRARRSTRISSWPSRSSTGARAAITAAPVSASDYPSPAPWLVSTAATSGSTPRPAGGLDVTIELPSA